MTPPLLETHLDSIVRSLRAPGLRADNVGLMLLKQGTVREVRFVPGSAQPSYILPGLGLAVLVQPAVAFSRVPALLEEVAKRKDVEAVILLDGRLRLVGDLPVRVNGKPFRFLGLAGPRG